MKYRIWHKIDKEFVNDRSLGLNPNGELIYIDCTDCGGYRRGYTLFSNQDNYIIQMSTGLKDKNGVEIYEGDIVLYGNTKHEVYRHDAGDYRLEGSTDLFYANEYIPLEVIGNIFENESD